MEKKKLLKFLIVLMFLIFFADRIGDNLNLYHDLAYWWFDMIMHFFGGFWVALFFVYFFRFILPVPKWLALTFIGLLLIGITWEIFEFIVFNNIGKEPFSWADTTADIFWDLAGGVAAVYAAAKRIMPTLRIEI